MSQKISVLHVCDHLGWAGSRMHGVKRLFAWTLPRFDPARFDVSLVSLRQKDTSEDTLEQFGVDVTYLHKGKFDPATLTALLKVMDRKGTQVLHLHGYGATTFGRLAAAMRGTAALLHEHANHTTTPWFQQVADSLLAPYTDLAIAVSKSTAEFTIRARKMPAEKTRVVYLGAPLEEFGRPRGAQEIAAAREALGITPGTFAVGTVTRLMPAKGNKYLIDAVGPIVEQIPSAQIYLAGEGELHGELEAQARALGVADRVHFLGFQRDVARVLSAFDLVVFPSLWEGTPLTSFEALAMGKPIVSTDADGLCEILRDGVDAVVVPKERARDIADAVVALERDPVRRAALGAEAQRTSRRYDIDAYVRKMERLYDLMARVSKPTKRQGLLHEDLSFLDDGVKA
ncbi:MAG: glycosyltransferase family 4 protein [Acidobacteria bacterium]|nr:glycosyltransferase family 4 protein [Acidobacteriota bacterium]